jgi:hypothetical protein
LPCSLPVGFQWSPVLLHTVIIKSSFIQFI